MIVAGSLYLGGQLALSAISQVILAEDCMHAPPSTCRVLLLSRASDCHVCVQAFGQVVTQENVEEPVRKRVAVTVAQLQATQGPQVGAVLQHLPPEQRAALADLTNHTA